MKTLIILFIAISALLPTGCGPIVKNYNINPDAFSLNPEQVPEVYTASTVCLINGQTDTEDVIIGEGINLVWKGNLHIWTDAAINQAARRLTAANVALAENGQKKLELSITEAELILGSVMSRCIVNLKVKIEDGRIFNFKGDHRSTAGIVYLPQVAMDGAVSNAAISMVNDPDIVRYLNQ